MSRLTEAELSELERLAKSAKLGPWWVMPSGPWGDAHIAYGTKGDLSDTYDLIDSYAVDTDYEYIAAANPQTMLALLADLRDLRAEAEQGRRVVDAAKLWAREERELRDFDVMSSEEHDTACDNLLAALAAPQGSAGKGGGGE